jgi:hypothetical protein
MCSINVHVHRLSLCKTSKVIISFLVLVLSSLLVIRIITLAPPKEGNKLGVWSEIIRLSAEEEIVPFHL